MPASSRAQQKAAAIAEHASPSEIAKMGPAVKQMASGMSKSQLHDFAAGSMKGKPEHVKHKPKHHSGRGSDNEMGRRRNPRGGGNPY